MFWESFLASKSVICPIVSNPNQLKNRYKPMCEPLVGGPAQRISTANTIRDRVTRGERLLTMLSENGTITPTGRDFLVAALDPMHDNQLQSLEGWPDVESTASVVRCIKQTLSYSTPNPAGGNWDFQLVLWPFLNSLQMTDCTRANNSVTYAANPPVTYFAGGLNGYQIAPGNSLNISNGPSFSMGLPTTYTPGSSRVVGIGVEVVNTTSNLHKQGQVIVWRQSNASTMASSAVYTVVTAAGAKAANPLVCPIQSPPISSAECMLIPGTRQWPAADGIYMVCPFVGPTNPPMLTNYDQPMIAKTQFADIAYNGPVSPILNVGPVSFPVQGAGAVAGGGISAPTKIYPLHQIGAFFQGLSQETTLSITMNVYLETFPTVAEPEILVLATPSAAYDPVALEIFSRCLTTLPIGVPAGMNVFGDWFTDIVSTVSDWTSTGLGAINPALGLGMKAAGEAAKAWRKKQGYDKVGQSPQSKPSKQIVRKKQQPQKARTQEIYELPTRKGGVRIVSKKEFDAFQGFKDKNGKLIPYAMK